jgi:hypothetical protein
MDDVQIMDGTESHIDHAAQIWAAAIAARDAPEIAPGTSWCVIHDLVADSARSLTGWRGAARTLLDRSAGGESRAWSRSPAALAPPADRSARCR